MPEEELNTSSAASPTSPADSHKRKLEGLELNNALAPPTDSEAHTDPVSVNNEAQAEENGGAGESEAKRPRLETNGVNVNETEGIVPRNEHREEEKEDDQKEEEPVLPQSANANGESVVGQESVEAIAEDPSSNEPEHPKSESAEELGQTKAEDQAPSEEIPREGDSAVPSAERHPGSDTKILSRRMEVPHDKVGVLIGKAGDTVRSLQDNSGAKIQIIRDADADPGSATRPLELVGTLQSINMAEKLIKDVIAEADAGGSPSLVARGFSVAQAAGDGEQLEIKIPIEKVGLLIGKGGEAIRNLQTRSGARIKLIQQNQNDGEQSRERTVRLTGNKKQIESAAEMIKDVMHQTIRPSPLSSRYNQPSFRPRGHIPQWGSHDPHRAQFAGYDYPQRGPYPSQGAQYPPPAYNYCPQQAPRSNFGPSWEQRPSASMNGPSPQGNYNYGQQQGSGYGQPPNSRTPAPQPYGHGYSEVKYGHQQFGHMATPYSQEGRHSDQLKPPIYGIQPQVPHSQSYVQSRPNQPGEVAPYQGSISSTQSYGQTVPPQQSYPYASSGQMQQQQTYPPYGSVPTTGGYGPAPSTAGYPAHGGQAYGQQAAAAYSQAGASGGYGSSYPTAQPGYAEQPAAAAYGGYQVTTDPAYGGAQGAAPTYPAGQSAYVQSSQTQPTYDHSAAAGYGNLPR